MNTKEIADKLVSLCNQGKNFEVMQTLYADNIVSVEATQRTSGSFETVGKEAVIKKSAEWASRHEIHSGAVDGPFLGSDKFAVVFTFDVTSKDSGKRIKLKEVGEYTVANGKIVREQFFYGLEGAGLAR